MAACSQVPEQLPETRAVGQMLRGGQAPTGEAFISFDVLLTEPNNGPAVNCADGKLDVKLEVSTNGGKTYKKVSTDGLEIGCEGAQAPDIALVVDNSGSEEGHLNALRKASDELARTIQKEGGRVSLVRVSTEATVISELTDERDRIATGIAHMSVNNGWTALYDGIRLGNETLGAATVAEDNAEASDVAAFCATQPKRGIVVFTDGNENNSSDEHGNEKYPGDAINTTLEDLGNLKVRGVTTPIYSVGLGKDVDEEGLHNLSEASGGKHHQIETPDALAQIFSNIAGYTGPRVHVCGELPTNKCGRLDVRMSYSWKNKSDHLEGSQVSTINVDCGDTKPAQARSATVLVSLTDGGIKAKDAASIATQTVKWVSPVAQPKVLLVLDDNHHGESLKDTDFIAGALRDGGYDVEFRNEPEFGMDLSEFNGFDVVWFSNPGYPMDDELTFSSLKQAASSDIGVILQGDDMTWSWGNSFDMSQLTHLNSLGNGTDACGMGIDNGGGGRYAVSLEKDKAFWGAVAGTSFNYSDDIDHSSARGEGETILAWSTVADAKGKAVKCDVRVPVVVAYDPANAK